MRASADPNGHVDSGSPPLPLLESKGLLNAPAGMSSGGVTVQTAL